MAINALKITMFDVEANRENENISPSDEKEKVEYYT